MSLGKKKMLSQGTSVTPIDGTPYFAPTIYTGNGTTKTVSSSLGFKPDMVWNKSRSAQFPHYLTDVVRGAGNVLRPSESDVQSSGDGVSSFDSNGFKVSGGGSNQNNGSYASWAWKAGGNSNTFNVNGTGYSSASAAGLDDGSITPTGASIDTTAGFSIVKFNSGSSTTSRTVSHGLGVKPAFVLFKKIDVNGGSWFTWHQSISPESYYLYLDQNNHYGNLTQDARIWGSRSFDSDVISWRSGYTIETNRNCMIYSWSEKDHQKFGTYTGSSSEHSVNIGFAPRFIMIKRTDANGSWRMYDSARDGTAVPRRVNHNLQANEISIEYDSTGDTSGYFHITSTGLLFYSGNTNPDVNANGGTFIYWAQA